MHVNCIFSPEEDGREGADRERENSRKRRYKEKSIKVNEREKRKHEKWSLIKEKFNESGKCWR